MWSFTSSRASSDPDARPQREKLNPHGPILGSLDRGWDLVQRGDTRGAEASARRALEIDPQSPEAYNLLGYVAALEGEASEAIENYRRNRARRRRTSKRC